MDEQNTTMDMQPMDNFVNAQPIESSEEGFSGLAVALAGVAGLGVGLVLNKVVNPIKDKWAKAKEAKAAEDKDKAEYEAWKKSKSGAYTYSEEEVAKAREEATAKKTTK